jgi:hypothetical protein
MPLDPGLRQNDEKKSRLQSAPTKQAAGVGCLFGAAEHRRENRIKLAPCLSVIERSEIASCAGAGFPEKHRVSGHKS